MARIIQERPLGGNFTMIPNAALRDNRLSMKAIGLYVYLRSLPPDANIDRNRLSDALGVKKDAVETAKRELVSAGFLKVVELRNGHRFEAGLWVLANSPGVFPETVPENPAATEPTKDGAGKSDSDIVAGFHGAGKVGAGKSGPGTLYKTDPSKTDPDKNADPIPTGGLGNGGRKEGDSGRRVFAQEQKPGTESAGSVLERMCIPGVSSVAGDVELPANVFPMVPDGRQGTPGKCPKAGAVADGVGTPEVSYGGQCVSLPNSPDWNGLLKEVLQLTQDPPDTHCRFWLDVFAIMRKADCLDVLYDGLATLRDAADPVRRLAKDIGEVRAPGAFLYARCRDALAESSRRMPRVSKARAAGAVAVN
jgi:hypothetical protein